VVLNSATTHLTDEDPDEPETARDDDHDDVEDEGSEAVAGLLAGARHNNSFRVVCSKMREEVSPPIMVLLGEVLDDSPRRKDDADLDAEQDDESLGDLLGQLTVQVLVLLLGQVVHDLIEHGESFRR